MSYTYHSDHLFKHGDVGKLLLYINQEDVRLAAIATDLFREIYEGQRSDEEMLRILCFGHEVFSKNNIFHSSIFYKGTPLGGSQFAVCNSRFLMTGISGSYGDIHMDSVRRAIEPQGLELATLNGDMIDRGPIEAYLARKLKP
jgi:hypothetical protein